MKVRWSPLQARDELVEDFLNALSIVIKFCFFLLLFPRNFSMFFQDFTIYLISMKLISNKPKSIMNKRIKSNCT